MPDVYLYSVPSDADPDDVRLRDPTTASSPSASGSAPVSAVAAITVTGQKGASSVAPISATAVVTASGEAAVAAQAERDPGTKGAKPWLYEVPQKEFPAEVIAQAERKAAIQAKRRATIAAKKAARAAVIEDEDEELIWLLAA